MKIAIFESIVTPAGHEVDFDRILVNELKRAGHEVVFFVPENYRFKLDYSGAAVQNLPGEAVSYAGASGLAKIMLSAKRELRRLSWFNSLYQHARQGSFDALIIPTATYRFLRTLRLSSLRKSPVPVVPLLHGINPGEAPRFIKQVEALKTYSNLRMIVISLAQDIFGKSFPNVVCTPPPFYPPIKPLPEKVAEGPLRLGFFGQYRREKNLDAFLKNYLDCRFEAPVKLLVQGATILPEDAADFERIMREYAGKADIEFLHKALIGEEWQQAIAGVDALIMPYSAERYRYHWSAMLFTAIGFDKSVIIADTINPEVLSAYDLGTKFSVKDPTTLKAALENFVNTYAAKQEKYTAELARAKQDFAPAAFVDKILNVIEGGIG